MAKNTFILAGIIIFGLTVSWAQDFEVDTIKTNQGDLKITCIRHGTLLFTWAGKIIHIDPVGSYADYSILPKADLILITHEHGDHLDPNAINTISKTNTDIVLTEKCLAKFSGGIVMKNGDVKTVAGILLEAVPAYNIKHMRRGETPYHPKGEGNGYILTLAEKRIYIGGDTENIPEMKSFKNIDIAFLPMNLPYTMTPAMVAEAAQAFSPKILYPYHYGNTDPQELVNLLIDNKEIEVRIRNLK